ncbi:MAG: hypothetical protein ACQEP5_04690 [Actinomycetota bacterium]
MQKAGGNQKGQKKNQKYTLVEGIPHKGNHFNVVSLEENNVDKITRFMGMADLKLSKKILLK